MLSSSSVLGATSKAVVKRAGPTTTAPVVSPAVVRSLYRGLYRQAYRLDSNPVAKTLFPLTKELQSYLSVRSALYTPDGPRYTAVLRETFEDTTKGPNVQLAFSTLTRLRAHDENVVTAMPAVQKDHAKMVAALAAAAAPHRDALRAELVRPPAPDGGRRSYLSVSPDAPSRLVLRDPTNAVELVEGTALLAHPLSSTHEDRRVMLVTERNALTTSAIVLDLQFIHPLSSGNPMFPEVFWGHTVYDGGYNQIEFSMPPTAQVVVLHTLEPPGVPMHVADQDPAAPSPTARTGTTTDSAIATRTGAGRWLRWMHPDGGSAASRSKATDPASLARQQHRLLCRPLIHGQVAADGTVEPTLYVSKVEALPYLAQLAPSQPRSSLRIYWGSRRWPTAQLEDEVRNGHWMPVKISPTFFRSYTKLSRDGQRPDESFPSAEEMRASEAARVRRYGTDMTPLQTFPHDMVLRVREALWDEIMYALGGEFRELAGCSNPFAGTGRVVSPQILSGPLPSIDTVVAPVAGPGPAPGTSAAPAPDTTTAAAAKDATDSDAAATDTPAPSVHEDTDVPRNSEEKKDK